MVASSFGTRLRHRKAPLPIFIEDLYEKRFGRRRPEKVLAVEELVRQRQSKEEKKGAAAQTAEGKT